jgi:GDP-4-dehydro-6-deoxy-D-mannose reductase
MLEAAAGRKFSVETDPALLRPSDEPIIFGSSEKLTRETGWQPKIALAETVKDVFQYKIRLISKTVYH